MKKKKAIKKEVRKSLNKPSNKPLNDSKEKFRIYFIFLRYAILLFLFLYLYNFNKPSDSLIYKILTPLTISPLIFLLKIFFSRVDLMNDLILINITTPIRIIPACIAGSAYLLLLLLNLSVGMKFIKRVLSLVFSLLLLFTINLLRLVIFSWLYVSNPVVFNFAHEIFWYFLSTIFVIGIWFITVKIFSLGIPVYEDIRHIIKKIKK